MNSSSYKLSYNGYDQMKDTVQCCVHIINCTEHALLEMTSLHIISRVDARRNIVVETERNDDVVSMQEEMIATPVSGQGLGEK